MRERPIILIVDDEPDVLNVFKTKLEASGFEVHAVENGEDAMRSSEQILPDLILMDIHLGLGETGTDVALKIKQNESTKGIKIAFLSSLKDPWPTVKTDREALTKIIGMEEFIDKTIDLDEFVLKVKEILAK